MRQRISRVIISAAVFLCAASIVLHPVMAQAVRPFDDIANSYAKNEIIHLYHKKILTGTSATTFSPTKSITRAEFITMIDRLLVLDPVEGPVTPFVDVPKSAWYYGWIQAAVQLELAKGTSATTFAPGKAVTRQEAAVWVARALKKTDNAKVASLNFNDEEQIAAWAAPAVSIIYQLGLIKGDTNRNFRPLDPITRQEAAILIDRVLQNKSWTAELEAAPHERIVIGWQYGQTTAQYQSTILKSNVNTLSPRWYFVGETGAVSDQTDVSLIRWAKKQDKQVWAMVGNRSNQEATHQMLSNSTARNSAINQLTANVKRYGLDGLNIDFENVAPADREAFTTFITLLSKQLKALNAVLSVDVSPDLGWDWTEAFDYEALGEQADYIVMMGYDEHYGGSVYPGPNASLPFDEAAVNKLLKVVSSKKVILAMPFYNRDWTLNQNGTVATSAFMTLTEQNQTIMTYALKPVWDAALGQYVASFTKNGLKHTIWFEDGRSLIAKYNLVVSKGLAGTAYWYIGGESSDVWGSLSNAEKFYDYSF